MGPGSPKEHRYGNSWYWEIMIWGLGSPLEWRGHSEDEFQGTGAQILGKSSDRRG